MGMKTIFCPFCGEPIVVDLDRTDNFCYCCGADLEDELMQYRVSGRNRYRYDTASYRNTRRSGSRHIFWWIMGFIFIAPLPITILVCRSRRIPSWAQVLICLAVWIIPAVIFICQKAY